MNVEELLETLKTEMMLACARAEGAKWAYEKQAEKVAYNVIGFRSGDKIEINYEDEKREAIFDKLKWSNYDIDNYEGPVLYGWILLQKGNVSKVYSPLCSFEMVVSGHVI